MRPIALCGLTDWLVNRRSAEGFHVDAPNPTFTGHGADSETLVRFISHTLAQYEPPNRRIEELRDIHGSPTEKARFQAECSARASAALNGYGHSDPVYVAERSRCFTDEFRAAFDRHPMRKLSLLEAFERYVWKVLED